MLVAAVISVPFGVYLLAFLQPHTVKLAIAVIVVVFALLLDAGVLSGILNGFSGISGPPAILYILNHDD
jgi:hypothetical protein